MLVAAKTVRDAAGAVEIASAAQFLGGKACEQSAYVDYTCVVMVKCVRITSYTGM